METDTAIEDVEIVSLIDEAIQEELGILAGRAAARAFAEWTGSTYEEDSN